MSYKEKAQKYYLGMKNNWMHKTNITKTQKPLEEKKTHISLSKPKLSPPKSHNYLNQVYKSNLKEPLRENPKPLKGILKQQVKNNDNEVIKSLSLVMSPVKRENTISHKPKMRYVWI
mmetsp:Transcript_21122/g.18729  ORF Transcript_21122/g.18729 Transcript_21122/m.18729 type:complete len:117 (-) Transcript_21122:20-370(-)